MAALTASKRFRPVKFSNRKFAAKNEAVFKGGLACIDRSTGLVAKGFASTTLMPIGVFIEDSAAAAGKQVDVDLFTEVTAVWMANHATDVVVAADIGNLCYVDDDQTVRHTDNTNANSVAGIVWAVDAVRGVLVEFRAHDSRLGGLDA